MRNNRNNRIGKTRTMNCGMEATIIEYINTYNISIQFKDGTIIKNKAYGSFKKGSIANPNLNKNRYINKIKIMNCGMKCKIIEYFNYRNITVQFEDGTIVKNKQYNAFKRGEITNPNLNKNKYLGETRLMNCGMKCKIIEYFNYRNITVQFEDGTIVKNKQYNAFKRGEITNPNLNKNKYLGETRLMNCGMKCKIIEYFNYRNITVQFEDGTIVKNKTYQNFKKGAIINPNLKSFTVFEGKDEEFTGNIKQISDFFNLNYFNLKNKINERNMTIKEAILMPLNYIIQNNLTYKGQKGSMKELCKLFNKNYIEVYNKVKFNHTFEWAMDSTNEPYSKE